MRFLEELPTTSTAEGCQHSLCILLTPTTYPYSYQLQPILVPSTDFGSRNSTLNIAINLHSQQPCQLTMAPTYVDGPSLFHQ